MMEEIESFQDPDGGLSLASRVLWAFRSTYPLGDTRGYFVSHESKACKEYPRVWVRKGVQKDCMNIYL